MARGYGVCGWRNARPVGSVVTGMTEQQRFTVLEKHDGWELRDYPSCVVADVQVDGSIEQAGTRAFGSLVSYISGRNEPGEKLAMTAPVVQEPSGDQAWQVSFVLPGERRRDAYPSPSDPQVTLREVPEHRAAALRWSGRWTEGNVEQHTRRLVAAVEAAGWRTDGPVRWARFDPPWTPAFLRHNEVIVTVVPAT